ncbi:MAG: LPS assembly protein LptD [Smithella sp.]|nr:LPS assembly protein LptD [Smithella sp.]
MDRYLQTRNEYLTNRIFIRLSQSWRAGFAIAFFVFFTGLFLCDAAIAFEPDDSKSKDFQDVYIVQDKMTVIYKGAAPDAGDTRSGETAGSPVASPVGLPDENGFVRIEADTMDYDNARNLYHARGKVTIFYSGTALSADEVELDNASNVAMAQGDALLKMGEDTLRGDKIVFNIEDKTGAAYNANAFYARNKFYIGGDKIEKTGEETYSIDQPTATTCEGDNPDWQITGSQMNVTIEGYGTVRNACFRARGIPVLYVPYIFFPAKTKRQTGVLLPYLAYSRDKDGLDIELPFFWAISQRMDATFYQRYIEKRGFKEGAEFRYYLGDKSFGTFYGDYLEDTKDVIETTDAATSRDWQGMNRRWSYYIHHQTNVNPQLYFRADLKKVSDKWYFKDFSAKNYYLDNYSKTTPDDFRQVSFYGDKSLRYLESTVRMFKGWSNYNLSGMLNTMEDFGSFSNDQTLQKYPELVLTGAKQQLFGTPVYFEFTGAYDYLYRDEGDKGHLIDFSPTLSMPFKIFNYFRVIPQFTLKETFWSRDDHETDSRKKTADRMVYNASVSLSSQLSRVFDVNVANWEKIRHEIKPEITYAYVPDIDADQVPDFYRSSLSPFTTPLSTLYGDALTKQNVVAWSLTNTLTSRIKDDTGAGYLEFMRVKLFQTYDINEARKDMTGSTEERRPFSNMGVEIDLKPYKYFSLKSHNLYNIYDGWKQNNLDFHFRDNRGDSLLIGYRNTRDFIEEINVSLKAVLTDKIEGTLFSKYDLLNSRKIENSVGFVYREQCWSVGFDVTETDDDVRFLFKVTLAGLGTVGIK